MRSGGRTGRRDFRVETEPGVGAPASIGKLISTTNRTCFWPPFSERVCCWLGDVRILCLLRMRPYFCQSRSNREALRAIRPRRTHPTSRQPASRQPTSKKLPINQPVRHNLPLRPRRRVRRVRRPVHVRNQTASRRSRLQPKPGNTIQLPSQLCPRERLTPAAHPRRL
jgi:hypothetical protein